MTFVLFSTKLTPLMRDIIHIRYVVLFFSVILTASLLSVCNAGELDDQLRLIRGSFEDGVLDLAASEAREFLSKAPNHKARGEVHLILGLIEKSSGHLVKARENFMKATGSDDHAIRLQGYYEAASLDWRAERFSDAADNYQAIVDENRGGSITGISRFWLVLSLFRAGDFQRVIDLADPFIDSGDITSSDQVLQIIYCRGQSFFKMDRLDESLSNLESVFSGGTPELMAGSALLIAKIQVRRGDYRLADLWAFRCLQAGFSREALMIRASAALSNGDHQGARYFFQQISEDPSLEGYDRQIVCLRLAVCQSRILAEIGRDWWSPLLRVVAEISDSELLAEILAEFSMHIAENQNCNGCIEDLIGLIESCTEWDAGTHGLQLANLCMGSRLYDNAIRWMVCYYSATNESIPEPSDRLILARLLSAMGDKSAASDELGKIDLLRQNANLDIVGIAQQAELLLQSGLVQQAASLYQEILVAEGISDSVRQSALLHLGDAFYRMEKWDLATDVFDRFLHEYPSASVAEKEIAMRRIAVALVSLAAWNRADRAASDYLDQFPETDFSGEMYYLKGLAQANQGRLDQALISMGLAMDRLSNSAFIDNVKESIRIISERQSLKNDGS